MGIQTLKCIYPSFELHICFTCQVLGKKTNYRLQVLRLVPCLAFTIEPAQHVQRKPPQNCGLIHALLASNSLWLAPYSMYEVYSEKKPLVLTLLSYVKAVVLKFF